MDPKIFRQKSYDFLLYIFLIIFRSKVQMTQPWFVALTGTLPNKMKLLLSNKMDTGGLSQTFWRMHQSKQLLQSLRLRKMYVPICSYFFYVYINYIVYRKVASRSTCYYSGNQVFGGATNQDMSLNQTCFYS